VDSNRLPRWFLVTLATLITPLALTSCGNRAKVPLAQQCREQIVLSLAPKVGHTERVIEGLEEDVKVRLEYLRSSTPTLFVYTLSARGRDPGCTLALGRLRQDSRVRFAEPDERRTVHGLAR
jgi:hypothetical protein